MDSEAVKVIIVEDRRVPVTRHQSNPALADRFDMPARAPPILRQDPDVIMIGEMRDTETAQIAVQSA